MEKTNKCKRCWLYDKTNDILLRQWCSEAQCYVILCQKCKTPEKEFRQYEVSGAVFD